MGCSCRGRGLLFACCSRGEGHWGEKHGGKWEGGDNYQSGILVFCWSFLVRSRTHTHTTGVCTTRLLILIMVEHYT